MENSLDVVIFAPGEETGFKSKRPKALHEILGLPLLEHVLRAAEALSPRRVILAGIREALPDRGLSPLEGGLASLEGRVEAPRFLLLSGDHPLLRPEALELLCREHVNHGALLSLLTWFPAEGRGCSWLARDESGIPRAILGEGASPEIREAAAGISCLENVPEVWEALRRIPLSRPMPELLGELIGVFYPRVHAVPWPEPEDLLQVRTRGDLARAEWLLRKRIVAGLQEAGVTVVDPATAYIGPDVVVGEDTVLHPGVYLYGRTEIGEGCEIGPQAYLVDSAVERGAVVRFSVLEGACVGEGARIGPYAHLRPGARIGRGARIGNFVEVKNAEIGEGVRAGHLAYIGDAEVGPGANIGAGAITCNYDGVRKHRTVIGEGAFIGSNAALVAPVTIGEGAVVGAGSVITEDVPPYSLALGRARQVVKPDWARRKKEGEG